jgi:mannose-6-phosphate isomerase-like protein (cupin superfamily)
MSSKKPREEHACNSAQECVKNRSWFSVVPWMGFLFFSLGLPLVSQAPQPKPIARSLECPGGDCPLLQGAPQTAGMRSGFVRLMVSASVGWHTTGQNEESLVILHGQGEVLIDAHEKQSFHAPAFAYIPATTVHNVSNTGKDILEYVYVVAPAAKR